MRGLEGPPLPGVIHSEQADVTRVPVDGADAVARPTVEEQLAQVIRLARNVAASAEEMLRELALRQQLASGGQAVEEAMDVDEALRPLDATRHQLFSAIEMLRPN